MINHRLTSAFAAGFFLASLSMVGQVALAADTDVGTTEITPTTLAFSTTGGNVAASVGPDGALLVGTPSASSTAQISEVLAS